MGAGWIDARSLRARGRKLLSLSLASAFFASVVIVAPTERALALVSPQQLAIRDGLKDVSDALAGLDNLDELGQLLPLSGLLPTSPQGLDVINAVKAVLDDALAAINAGSADDAIEDALNALDGTSVGAGITAHVQASVTDNDITFSTLSFTRTSTTPLSFATEGLSLDGATLTTDLALSFTDTLPLVLTLDTVGAPTLYLPALAPNASLTADLALDVDPGLDLDLGILTVTATGDGTTAADISASADFTIDWLDPDTDGRITLTELTTSAPLDLFDVGFANSSVDIDLTVAANSALLSTLTATGTISLHDSDLSDGLDAPTVNLPELENFTNMTPEQIVVAIAQFAVSLQAMQTRVANPDVPVIGADPNAAPGSNTVDNLADILDINAKIGDFFVSKGLSSPENPFELKIGDADGNGVIDGGEVTLESVGLGNIDAIIDELATYVGDTADLAYDADTDALTFNLAFSSSFTPVGAIVTLNDQLSAMGLRGLVSVNGAAGVGFDAGYTLDLDLGIDLTEVASDTPITDRLFIDTAGTEVTGDARVTADLDVVGTLGFLELSLTDTDTDPGADGFVTLLDRRASDPSTPMVTIDLDGGADGRILLSELFTDLGSVDVAAAGNVLTVSGPNATVTGTVNAGVPDTTVNAAATIGDDSLAGATLTFGWPDIFGAPTLTADAAFNDDFLSFNFDSSNPLALFNSIIETIDKGMGALDAIDSDVLDEDLPIIGTSFRDSVAFLDSVHDTINEIAQDPAGSLQRLEAQVELAVAQGLGVDLSALGALPDPNDPTFYNDGPDGTPGTGDDFFDDAAFQQALDDYFAAVQGFFTGDMDFVTLGYEPGNSPGAVTISFKIGVCSMIDAQHPGCTRAIPLSKAFNFDFDAIGGDFAGLIAAESAGELVLDYNASVQIDLGVQLPDVANGDFTPRPFIADTSAIDLSLAGSVTGAFDASIGPFAISVGNNSPVPEAGADCANATDDDGDGFVNDGCPPVEAPEPEADCANATDDDQSDDESDGGASTVNDGCAAQAAPVQAEAGAAFHLQADFGGDSQPTRVYLLEGSNLTDYLDGIVAAIPSGLTANSAVDCGSGAVFACASLPLFVNAGGSDIFLGTIDGAITSLDPFTHTFDPNDLTAIKDALLANADNLAWQLVGQGLKEFGDYLEEATNGTAYDVEIPVIGDVLDAGAELGTTFNTSLAQPVGDFLQTTPPTDLAAVKSTLETLVTDAVGPSGADLLQGPVTVTLLCGGTTECDPDGPNDSPGDSDDHTMLDVTDVSVRFTIGDTIAEASEIPFDFGFPGLRLATADGDDPGSAPDGVKAAVEWSIDVGFGLSLEDGFYIATDFADAEIELEATVNTPDFTADIAFLGIEIDSDNSDTAKPGGRSDDELSLSLAIDLPDDGDGKLSLTDLANVDPIEFLPVIEANVDIYWRIQTAPEFGGADASNGAMPTLKGTINITGTATLSVDGGLEFTGLAFGFDDIALDLGTFVDQFLGPILAEVQKFTKPLQPVIDVVSAPIPGISQLAELVGADPVTLLSLFEAISGNDLTLIKTLIEVITFVNSMPAAGSVTGDIVIGSFDVALDKILDTELPANRKGELVQFNPADLVTSDIGTAIAGLNDDFATFKDAFASNLSSADPQEFESEEPGFTFPAFQDLSQMFNLLVGQDVTLVRFASGPLKAEFGFSQSFGPIAVGPVPVSIVISGSASIEGRFAVGYDTKGIRQLVQMLTDGDSSNDDFLTGFGFLFNGLFLDDLNAAGQDVPEIRLVVEFAAGAAVDLVVVSAGVEGGVRATIDMNLHDGGFFDPIPPENLDGKLRLDEIASFLFGNPLCLFDVSGKLEAFIRIFVEIDLFLFSARFEFTVVNITLLELDNITAELCEPPPPQLASDIGDGVLRLNMGPNAGDRNYSPDTIDEKFVVKQLGPNTVEVNAFGLSQVFGPDEDGPFQITVDKVVGDGGSGKDTVRFDPGSVESVSGDDVESEEIPFVIPTEVCGGPSDDKLSGGEGADVFAGDGAQNGTGGGSGWACVLTEVGSDGADQLGGLGGDDTQHGGGGADLLNGDSGDDTIDGGSGDDAVNGGIGRDTLNGGAGNDNIKGGADRDPALPDVPDDESNDVIDGDDGDDTIDADFGDDDIDGGAGNDVIVAGPGSDTAEGEGDEDIIFGNDGDDALLDGGDGDDSIFGMLGNDNIRGGADDDNLIGNEGDDDIEGGDGKDVILGDNGEINRAPNPGTSDFALVDPAKPLVTLIASDLAAGDTNLSGDGDTDVIYGQEGDDTIEGGAADDELHGNAGDDTMSGDSEADTMFGDAGSDVMYGDNASASNGCADGGDNIRGGDQDDTISGNAAGDSLFGDNGDDLIYGDADTPNASCDAGDTARGGPLDDEIFGNADSDAIFGDGGEDRLVGGSDDADEPDAGDTISGGVAADVIAGDNAIIDDAPSAVLMLVTLRLDGQGAGDTIAGDGGDDRIFGQVGDDGIDAGSGADYVEGNDGSDTIAGGDGADDLIGGSSAADGIIDDDRAGDERPDAGDTITGGSSVDYIAGDNALVSRNVIAADRAHVELFDVGVVGDPATAGTSGGDMISGGSGADQIFGQGGDDVLNGDKQGDYIEGNDGNDTIHGNDGDDDLVGGGSANDGVIDADRVGDTLLDVGETLISGDAGEDWMTGDNALIDRNVPSDAPAPIVLFDVETTASGALPGTGGGEILMTGGDGPDWMFGQTGDDTMQGNAGADYVEGNNGDDTITGDGGDDDLVGGGSADDGVIDGDRVGDTLLDVGESLVSGGSGIDWITGDNALVNRNRPVPASFGRAPIELFDVQVVGSSIATSVSGGDLLHGDDDDDRIFGQGNGAQPATQTDPADGRNNDYVGSAEGTADFDRRTADPTGVDEDAAGWLGDVILGGVGDDEIEGNHGNDVIFGDGASGAGHDEDDIAGGGSADDGKLWNDSRLGLGANLLDGADTIHGDSTDDTAGDDDAVIGDNGWIRRTGATQVGTGPDGAPVDLVNRSVQMTQTRPPDGTFGNDHVLGNGGHDELYGQAGDDAVEGGWGSDAVLGDLGTVTTDLLGVGSDSLCTPARTIRPQPPFLSAEVCQPGTLFRLVQLYAFDDRTPTAVIGADVLLGGDGDDWMHGGAGSDLMQGDGDGGAETPHPTLPGVTVVADPNPASADVDRMFGGDSNGAGTVDPITGGDGDAIWGGRGDDHTFGGRGDDMQDIYPDALYPTTWGAWAEADVESFHDLDIIYGGFDQDAMQANIAGNGPVEGDRVIDWAGVYNITYLCPATYGAYVTIRGQSPSMIDFVLELAATDGALTPDVVASSGGNEVAMVYKPDVKDNTHPIYPGTPGHFVCPTP